MKARCCALALILVWVGAASSLAQGGETIIGELNGPPGPDGVPQNSATGALPLTGWALSDTGVEQIRFRVDGVDVGSAVNFGRPRPDVTQRFPGFFDSAAPGFGHFLNTTDFPNGLHQVELVVRTRAGNERIVDSDTFFFNNNTTILLPFGRINFPQRNSTLVGTCNLDALFVPEGAAGAEPRRISVVDGWALDLGVEIGDTGIGFVELLIDGAFTPLLLVRDQDGDGFPDVEAASNTRLDCRFDQATGGFTNCYGLPRLDIERRFPFTLDAQNAGYRFAVDFGLLHELLDISEGAHNLLIRAGDISGQFSNVAEIPVNFVCKENIGNEPSFGEVLSPRIGRVFAGSMDFVGWALDGDRVKRVEVLVDGVPIGPAIFPAVGSVERVRLEFPGFPDSAAPVWALRGFDSNQLTDGAHQAQVIVTDDEDQRTVIGEATFIVDNVR